VTRSASRDRLPGVPNVDPQTQEPIPTQPLVSKRTRRITAIVGGVVAVVLLALLILLGYLAYIAYDVPPSVAPATVRLRDMAVIVIALETILLMLLTLFIAVLLAMLVILIYDRVIPILEQTNRTINTVADTVSTVRGTTTFVSDKLVTPVIEASGYVAGAARILQGVKNLVREATGHHDHR